MFTKPLPDTSVSLLTKSFNDNINLEKLDTNQVNSDKTDKIVAPNSNSEPNSNFINSTPNSSASSPKINLFKSPIINHFDYDITIYNQLLKYIETNNHHGLALISRQKGIPPFLRFKIWPTLLKYHVHVRNPFIQPDNDDDEDDDNSNTNDRPNEEELVNDNKRNDGTIEKGKEKEDQSVSDCSDKSYTVKEFEVIKKIRKDLKKYIQRLKYSSQVKLNENEEIIFNILEQSILKFSMKWSKIIKYDQSLTWMALNLAEWFPPIPNTPWVLFGRDNTSSSNSLLTNIMEDYSSFIEFTNSQDQINKYISEDNMKFSSVYERVVLVLLHSSSKKSSEIQSKTLLPLNGGTIEERVSFFIYGLRKLLPELSQFFSDEQILSRFGSHDDEWLIWWLKFAGSKVWSKSDRGRVWDLIFGWRLKNPKKSIKYYFEKLEVSEEFITKLGPDIFWTLNNDNNVNNNNDNDDKLNSSNDDSETTTSNLHKNSSFKNLVEELSSSRSSLEIPDLSIPFSRLDPQFELIFVSLAILKSKENLLVELDQHEVRQFLSRLPSKSFKTQKKSETEASPENRSPIASANNSPPNKMTNSDTSNFPTYKEDYMDKILNESGDLWRKWLWMEMVDDN